MRTSFALPYLRENEYLHGTVDNFMVKSDSNDLKNVVRVKMKEKQVLGSMTEF